MRSIVKGIESFLAARNATEVKVKIYDPGGIGARLVPFTKQIVVFFNLGTRRFNWGYIFDNEVFTRRNVNWRFEEDFTKIRRKDMEKCPKHCWHKIKVKHIYEMDLKACGINYAFGVFYIEICLACGKIKGRHAKDTFRF